MPRKWMNHRPYGRQYRRGIGGLLRVGNGRVAQIGPQIPWEPAGWLAMYGNCLMFWQIKDLYD
jgi:hypothetical protein